MATEPINLPMTDDIGELRKALQIALQRLAIRIDDGTTSVDLDLTDHRLKNVAWPAHDHDAVNVAYLKDLLKVQPSVQMNRMQKYLLNVASGGTSTTTIGTGYQLEVLAP
jgi:hypothetical protein